MTVTTAPKAPTTMSATSAIYSVTVNWGAVSGATGYVIRFNNSDYPVTGTSKTFTGLRSKTNYTYQMCSKNADGAGNFNTSKTIQTLPALPAVPSGITKSATENTATINWSAASGATGYDVLFNGSVQSTTGRTMSYYGLTANRGYSFQIRAKMQMVSAHILQQ